MQMTVAVVDRLVHHATIFEMNVESYRRRAALVAAHHDHRHPTPPRQASGKPTSVTSLSVRPVTFLSVVYIGMSHNCPSGKSACSARGA
jgi:hypothetical protein